MSTLTSRPPDQSGPAWEIARLFPDQGQWGEGDYLELKRRTNRLVELSDGQVEVLDIPTRTHQRIVLLCGASPAHSVWAAFRTSSCDILLVRREEHTSNLCTLCEPYTPALQITTRRV